MKRAVRRRKHHTSGAAAQCGGNASRQAQYGEKNNKTMQTIDQILPNSQRVVPQIHMYDDAAFPGWIKIGLTGRQDSEGITHFHLRRFLTEGI